MPREVNYCEVKNLSSGLLDRRTCQFVLGEEKARSAKRNSHEPSIQVLVSY